MQSRVSLLRWLEAGLTFGHDDPHGSFGRFLILAKDGSDVIGAEFLIGDLQKVGGILAGIEALPNLRTDVRLEFASTTAGFELAGIGAAAEVLASRHIRCGVEIRQEYWRSVENLRESQQSLFLRLRIVMPNIGGLASD